MKRTAQIAVIGALLAVGIAQSHAQSNAVVVSTLNVTLTGFAGGSNSASPARIGTKDIINALNASSGGFNFGKGAKLVMFVPAAGGSPRFLIREGHTDTDVSDFFGTDTTGVISNGKQQYDIFSLSFSNGAGTSFDVSGFTTAHIGTVRGRDTGALDSQITSFNASVSGTGDVDGNSAVLKGTISDSGAKGELH